MQTQKVEKNSLIENNYLVEQIIELTKDPKSKLFWMMVVQRLPKGVLEEEMGELRYQINMGRVRDPAKYLTALFMKQMEKLEACSALPAARPEPAAPKKLNSHFEDSQMDLFSNLMPVKVRGQAKKKAMETPYGKDIIPWATFVSSNFFTLSTNKAKSDVVLTKFRTLDGEVSTIPLIRGRVKPGGKERGILTAEHGRIFAAIKSIWSQQGCQRVEYSSGAVVCFCLVSIRELAKLLGRSAYGGKDLVELTDKVYDLKVMPYYFDLSDQDFGDMVGYGFTLFSKVEVAERKKRGQIETVLSVEFSTPLSTQLLNRHAVTRSKDLPQIQSELGFLLRLYLEPILLGMKAAVFSKSLKDLIADLALPPAGWHGHKGKCRQVFMKALRSMRAQRTTNGRPIIINIEKIGSDWMLKARLGKPGKIIEMQAAKDNNSNKGLSDQILTAKIVAAKGVIVAEAANG